MSIVPDTMPMISKAFLLSDGNLTPDDRNVGKLLDFFGIPWEAATIREIAAREPSRERLDGGKYGVLSSAPVMAEAVQGSRSSRDCWQRFAEQASSVFIYGFQETDLCRQLVRLLTGNKNANICRFDSNPTLVSVTSTLPEMCGPLSGLQVPISPADADLVLDMQTDGAAVQRIIATEAGEVFARVAYGGLSFFLSACRETVDLDTRSRKPFDVKKCFCGAIPIVMYLRWAFRDVCWKGAEPKACLIVDDPPLKPRYGFLRFRRALELMDEHNFTMSLAFIPWNQRRTDPDVVELFQDRADRLSLSIHGCDHTGSEFATRSSAELNARTKVASQRMKSLFQRTSLGHDRVMIFPQGEFSTETGRVLKLNGFLAAVNTEVTPSHEAGNGPKIADLWDVALNTCGTFPIFTRRYFTHGLENFAFEILLGKPCLLVAHHQEFENDGRDLVEFIDKLNSLTCKLIWGSLGEVIRGSFRSRSRPDGTRLIRMYASTILIENEDLQPCATEFVKEESDADCVGAVLLDQEAIPWESGDGYLRFRATIPSQGRAEAAIVYMDRLGNGSYPSAMRYRVKTGVRRYLSEARDQYLSQNDVLNKSAAWMRRVLR
jgi:hypothetical protein